MKLDPCCSVTEQSGTRSGFAGCVRSLRINAKVYDLRQMISGDIRGRHGVGECGVDPCSAMPCQNHASCSRTDDERFRCLCAPGFEGTFCERASADACASRPCQHGGTCVIQSAAPTPFRCICPPGRTGPICAAGSSYPLFPSFALSSPQHLVRLRDEVLQILPNLYSYASVVDWTDIEVQGYLM